MKSTVALFVSIFFTYHTSAQFTKYIVRLKDKAGTPFSISNPSAFLSSRSILRRTKQNIVIDETDLPVTPRYIDSIRLAGNISILNVSKWLNQVCIKTTDTAALAKINSMSFVIATKPLMQPLRPETPVGNKLNEEINSITSSQSISNVLDFYNYGNSFAQIHIHEGEYVHDKGFHGEGMSIAILDAGFYHYQSLPAFDSVRTYNQVKETFNFVTNDTSVNEDYFHGMECFSILAANLPGQLVGTSPKANYYLYVSEDVTSESPVEEQNWVAAAEKSDSNGVDVISTSLGYNQFDNPIFNNTYADLNGHTTIIAKAAGLAAKKGMIVVVAAGNEGTNSWHYITTPADADSIVAVGAVNVAGTVANFSSYGPSSDGRIKPEIASVGQGTALCSTIGTIVYGNGTSFATPNVAGLITCLWQAFPDFTNMEIIKAVEESSSIYNAPGNRIGYGIPNFRIAFDNLTQQRSLRNISSILGNTWIKAFPIPFQNNFSVAIKPPHTAAGIFSLYEASGRLILIKSVSLQAGQNQLILFNDLQPLSGGIYFLKFNDGQSKKTLKLLVR